MIAITASLEEAARCDAILLVVPAQALREVASALGPLITNGMPGGKAASIALEDAVSEALAGYSSRYSPLLEREVGR